MRRLERWGPQAFLDNTLHDVLTVPAGHKFELIESGIETLGTGGEVLAVYLKTAGPAYTFLDVIVGNPAGGYLFRNNHEGCVAYEGEGFSVAGYLVGGSWSAWLMYIDVAPV